MKQELKKRKLDKEFKIDCCTSITMKNAIILFSLLSLGCFLLLYYVLLFPINKGVVLLFFIVFCILFYLFFLKKIRFKVKVILTENEIIIYKNDAIIVKSHIDDLLQIKSTYGKHIEFLFPQKKVVLSNEFTKGSTYADTSLVIEKLLNYFYKTRLFNLTFDKIYPGERSLERDVILINPSVPNKESWIQAKTKTINQFADKFGSYTDKIRYCGSDNTYHYIKDVASKNKKYKLKREELSFIDEFPLKDNYNPVCFIVKLDEVTNDWTARLIKESRI